MGSIREYPKEDGGVSFHAEVRLRGHPPQRATFRNKSLAKKWIQDTESAIRDGRHFKTAEAKRHTVGELIDRFIAQWLPNSPKGQAKQTALLSWWKEFMGRMILADLGPSVIAEGRDLLLSQITVRGSLRSPSTVNRYLSALGKVLTIAMKEYGWIEDNPMRKVTKPPEGKGRDRFLTLEEKEQLLKVCRASSNPHLYPIVRLALLTGMRLGEILNLKWEDIDLSSGTGIITMQETKNGEKRVIPLTRDIEAIFKEIGNEARQSGLIFQSLKAYNKASRVDIRKPFLKALEVAGIRNFRFHDLRHTAASYLAMEGATQGELMAILGHRTASMSARYSHYSQDHIRKIMEKAGSKLVEISKE